LDYIFFISVAVVLILVISAVSKAEELKNEIRYEGSTMSLYYLVQNSLLPHNDFPISLKSVYAKKLYGNCINRIKLGVVIIVINTLLVLIFE
jgi:hypothetical protein